MGGHHPLCRSFEATGAVSGTTGGSGDWGGVQGGWAWHRCPVGPVVTPVMQVAPPRWVCWRVLMTKRDAFDKHTIGATSLAGRCGSFAV